jgi:hypothetical protein
MAASKTFMRMRTSGYWGMDSRFYDYGIKVTVSVFLRAKAFIAVLGSRLKMGDLDSILPRSIQKIQKFDLLNQFFTIPILYGSILHTQNRRADSFKITRLSEKSVKLRRSICPWLRRLYPRKDYFPELEMF